jgi:hypothetical protein
MLACVCLTACASESEKQDQQKVYQGPGHKWSPDLDSTDSNGKILRAIGLP